MFFTAPYLDCFRREGKGSPAGSQPSARWIECKVQPEMRKISYFTKEKCQFETRPGWLICIKPMPTTG
nr:hypothetical protein Q903MT_gene4844 [Picea sitchensis]